MKLPNIVYKNFDQAFKRKSKFLFSQSPEEENCATEMDNFVKGYYAYLDYFRESFGGSITPPTYNEWLINLNENQDSNQDSNLRVSEQDSLQQYSQQSNQQQKTDDDDKASHSSYSLSVQPKESQQKTTVDPRTNNGSYSKMEREL